MEQQACELRTPGPPSGLPRAKSERVTLSLTALATNLGLGFPISHRDGWTKISTLPFCSKIHVQFVAHPSARGWPTLTETPSPGSPFGRVGQDCVVSQSLYGGRFRLPLCLRGNTNKQTHNLFHEGAGGSERRSLWGPARRGVIIFLCNLEGAPRCLLLSLENITSEVN